MERFVTNMLILMSDEHNYRVSSVYGHGRVETPTMARLAREGVTYDAAYCPSPLCAPSRSSFLSGLPVHQVGVYNNCRLGDADLPSSQDDRKSHHEHDGEGEGGNSRSACCALIPSAPPASFHSASASAASIPSSSARARCRSRCPGRYSHRATVPLGT